MPLALQSASADVTPKGPSQKMAKAPMRVSFIIVIAAIL
jgi:hypothetical protein